LVSHRKKKNPHEAEKSTDVVADHYQMVLVMSCRKSKRSPIIHWPQIWLI